MGSSVSFHHRWWHKLGIWLTVLLSALLGGACSYAALFAQPHDKNQWFPLLALIIASWASFVHYLRIRKTPNFAFIAGEEGVSIQGPTAQETHFFPWSQVTEVHKGSNLTGCGFLRCGSTASRYLFCNWFGEANALVEFSIERCIQEHGA